MIFCDVHNHLLYSVDDGAKDKEMMLEMIHRSYTEGVRYICLTPHYHPGYYGRNKDKSDQRFAELAELCREKYPDLTLALGNELHYAKEFSDWMKSGECRTMAGGRYLLVDFTDDDSADDIIHALTRISSRGYSPILAHAERYRKLGIGHIRRLADSGVLIQINASSPLGGFGFGPKRRAMAIIKKRLCDLIGSDAHNLTTRKTRINECYRLICKKVGESYASWIFKDNAISLIFQDKRKDNSNG